MGHADRMLVGGELGHEARDPVDEVMKSRERVGQGDWSEDTHIDRAGQRHERDWEDAVDGSLGVGHAGAAWGDHLLYLLWLAVLRVSAGDPWRTQRILSSVEVHIIGHSWPDWLILPGSSL
jgi:hypothetical protein